MDNITWRPPREERAAIRSLRNYIRESNEDPSVRLFGIFLDNRHIGNIRFACIDSQGGACTLGILIGDSNSRGKGLAAEAIRLGCEIIKRDHNISSFELRVFSWNKAAIRAYSKAGFEAIETGTKASKHPDGVIMALKLSA